MNRKLLLGLGFCTGTLFSAAAQDKANVKYGVVMEKDFETKIYSIDSNANAVVVAEIGESSIEGNTKGWFSIVSKRYKRVHILNKNGFDIGNVSISLYSVGTDEEKLDKLKAVTYNLENGKVVETKLDTKSGLFEDKISKQRKIKKFTFPNLKEGSIIEFEYTTTSDYIQYLDPWEFQGIYPVLWSEYNLTVPSFFYYVFLKQGYLRYDVDSHKEGQTTYSVIAPNDTGPSERFQVKAGYTDYRWVVKNVPALKEEAYTSTLDNHIQKIDFILVERRDPLKYYRYIESWQQIAGELLEAEYFGEQLEKDNGWLKDIMGAVLGGVRDKEEKARKIYTYVRDNFTCTVQHGFAMNQTLKTLLKNKNGNVAEINLLLTTMLKYEGIDADPVILSTRSNGTAYSVYPVLSQYNYTICRTVIDGKRFYLDASEPHMGFGHLPLRCYNGEGRIINKQAVITPLSPDSVKESKMTIVFIINDEKGNLIGSIRQTPGYYESDDLRERIKEKGQEQLQKDIKKDFGADIVISNFGIDSLDIYDFPLGIHYDFDIKDEKEDIIYLNPQFGEGYKENPFKSAERKYPVEMPFVIDEIYNLQLEVPHGYVVDELPKSMILKLNELNEGMFEYHISQSGETISLRSRIILKRTYFMPEEYEVLREFFNLVVKKQAEQIVFKKKK
ncbi:MAG TPA: DUF3857 domain-containing protein [Chitinophagaceae bacterium]|nr:DUF3857 domain-containing protein [Chitinophagaceae bacterium]